MRYNLKKTISAVMVGAMLLAASPIPLATTNIVYADEMSDAEAKKADAQQKKKDAQSKLAKLESDKKDVMELIEDLDKEITSYEGTIRELQGKSNTLQAKASVAENELQMAYIAEANQYEAMKERIQFAYENGDADYIDALVSIKDYDNVINQSEYVSQVSGYDQKQLNDLLEIEKSISEYKATISDNLSEVASLKEEAEGEQGALQVIQDGKLATLKEYNLDIAATEYTIEQMNAIEAQQDAQIAAIVAAASARRAAAEQTVTRTVTVEVPVETPASTASSTDATPQKQETKTVTKEVTETVPAQTLPSYSGSGFIWPSYTRTITSYYGPRTSPTAGASSYHRGIDIGASYGSGALAAADGVVSYTGWFSGGGNTVIIDHGNGLSTLYMHLSGFAVSQGSSVSAGQTVGYVGSTGISTGPHLHFAVMVGGSYVNPLGYY
ncbi:MAG: peptidoglycan DD-metalloendopeptidase family protein [Eubacterium sp.]|nr:peptidoglycan DD-metalloendopeptidase family protein [Eubacterium sp.]